MKSQHNIDNHPLKMMKFCPICGEMQFEVNDEKSKKCRNCGFVYYFNPAASVAAIIQNEQHEILICRRANSPFKDTLDLPGGFVDRFESAEKALQREIKEELNIYITDINYLFSLPNIYPFCNFNVHTLDLFFKCKTQFKNKIMANDDVKEAFFIPIEKLNINDFGLTSIRKGLEIFLNDASLEEK